VQVPECSEFQTEGAADTETARGKGGVEPSN